MVKKFDTGNGSFIGKSPTFPPESIIELRMRLIREEKIELEVAVDERDFLGTADAIADLIYVLIGMSIAFGFDLRPVFAEVQRANMAKIGGPKRDDGKQLKPEGWRPPDLARAIQETWDVA